MNRKNSFYDKIRKGLAVFVCVVSIILISSGCSSEPKVYRVGILSGLDAFINIADGFTAKMTELGYVENKNIMYDVQKTNMDQAEMQKMLEKFVVAKVDLIFAFPTEPALLAKEAVKGTNIPVVFDIAGIEGNNLVESVPHPGGNITGIRYPGPDLVVKRFEILIELAPWIKRLYIPYDPAYPTDIPALAALRPVALSKGVTLVEAPSGSVEDIRASFDTRAKTADIGMDAIQILPELLTQSPAAWALISQFAKEHKIPLVGSQLSSADNGSVFSYCVNFYEVGRLAAPLADKIFKGIPAGTIPLITPEATFRINFKIIQELGLKVSESLLSQANEIIR